MPDFNPSSYDLPVAEIIPAVKQSLANTSSLIIQAPPGAGKSTLLPLALLKEPWLAGKKILLLEPRRLATKSIAQRMSNMLGEELGQTVGYRIRFDLRHCSYAIGSNHRGHSHPDAPSRQCLGGCRNGHF